MQFWPLRTDIYSPAVLGWGVSPPSPCSLLVWYLVKQGSGACIDENCCYGNHFNSSCTLMFVGGVVLQWFFIFFTLILLSIYSLSFSLYSTFYLSLFPSLPTPPPYSGCLPPPTCSGSRCLSSTPWTRVRPTSTPSPTLTRRTCRCATLSGSVVFVFSANQLSCVWHHTTVQNSCDVSTCLYTHCMCIYPQVQCWSMQCLMYTVCCTYWLSTHTEVSRCRVSIFVHRHESSLLTAHAWWNNYTQCVYFSVVHIAQCCHWSLAMYCLQDHSGALGRCFWHIHVTAAEELLNVLQKSFLFHLWWQS